jgi:putative oxidoreductase
MQYGQWIGRTALALIFLFNALGIVDQTRPAHELAAHGAPAALVPTLIMAGRALQLVAGIALVIGWHERVAALLLALFLIPATLTAHDFWASPGPEFQGQLVNFLKNLAMFGGLCFVAFRLPTAAAGARRAKSSEEGYARGERPFDVSGSSRSGPSPSRRGHSGSRSLPNRYAIPSPATPSRT